MLNDLETLVRDKYEGDAGNVTEEDEARLAAGEPLAYVIGWLPFLGLRIGLSSKPLIPRPETEWWTKELIDHLHEHFADAPFRFLDLCAGSGAIGLSILKSFPSAHVSFGELISEHIEQIKKNIELNQLDMARTDVRASDLFASFDAPDNDHWDIIAANPPYIPAARITELDHSVTRYEPHEALFSGPGGLDLIRRITAEAPSRLNPGGELWVECDIANIEAAKQLLAASQPTPSSSAIRTDQYGRPRVLVSYFP